MELLNFIFDKNKKVPPTVTFYLQSNAFIFPAKKTKI